MTNETDIVERLEVTPRCQCGPHEDVKVTDEAAALIRSLRAENERLRAERDAGIAEGMERAAVIENKWGSGIAADFTTRDSSSLASAIRAAKEV